MTEKGMTLTEKYLDCVENLNSVNHQLNLYRKALKMLAADYSKTINCESCLGNNACNDGCDYVISNIYLNKAIEEVENE